MGERWYGNPEDSGSSPGQVKVFFAIFGDNFYRLKKNGVYSKILNLSSWCFMAHKATMSILRWCLRWWSPASFQLLQPPNNLTFSTVFQVVHCLLTFLFSSGCPVRPAIMQQWSLDWLWACPTLFLCLLFCCGLLLKIYLRWFSFLKWHENGSRS